MLWRLLSVLRDLEPNRHFLKLWLSQLLSLTAFNMVNFTLLLRVFEITNSATFVSLFVLSFGLPSLFFGAIAGVFADRWDRRRVLIVTNLLRAIAVLAYLPTLNHLPTIYITTFAIATITQFFTPAEGALIPELVERKRLVAANTLFIITMFATFVLGYGLAGPLASAGGDDLPIVVAAVMFGLATIADWLLPATHGQVHRIGLAKAYRDVFGQLREGLRLARRIVPVRYGLLQLTFIWSVIGVVMVLLPVYTGEVLGLNLREVSRLIILPIGIGMLGGGYVLHRARRQFSTKAIVGTCGLLSGLALVTLGQIVPISQWLTDAGLGPGGIGVTEQLVTSISSTVLGLTMAIVMIASQTLIHENTGPRLRGRMFGVLGMSVNAANTVPVLAAGLLTDLFRASTVVTAVGCIVVGWAVISSRFRQRLPGPATPIDTA